MEWHARLAISVKIIYRRHFHVFQIYVNAQLGISGSHLIVVNNSTHLSLHGLITVFTFKSLNICIKFHVQVTFNVVVQKDSLVQVQPVNATVQQHQQPTNVIVRVVSCLIHPPLSSI